jgi:hypothetical protein
MTGPCAAAAPRHIWRAVPEPVFRPEGLTRTMAKAFGLINAFALLAGTLSLVLFY